MTSKRDAGLQPVGLILAVILAAWIAPGPASAAGATTARGLPVMGAVDTPAAKADQVERDRIAGVAAFEHGDFALATLFFKRVRQLDPANDEGMFLLGRAYLANGDASGAVDQFTNAIARNDKVEKYFYARGKAEMKLGKYAAAVADFNRDLELRDGKGSSTFFLSRADAYLGNGETDLAIKDYGQVAGDDGEVRLARLHRGIALARVGDIAGAIEDFNTAETMGRAGHTLDFDTFFYRGVVNQIGGDSAAALRDYRAAAEFKDPRRPLAQCLADAISGKRHGLFGGDPKECRNFDAAKALQSQPAA
ncbi:tetratricopeptide repeat protein [Phenylobacterium montanum]|uniref:Tetratricopeptide repeat protein n=1 Tax=Phenylobacterium montanum TaxID=2823693 RepID=A0A975G1W5_9CAUL|nr:tetratricopeptide repeat protein [Caulobacter sp. S6]QUD89079.1 tetratricopeptide repeat protein [Caulobacter sp. S6]